MKAIVYTEYGPPPVLQLIEIDAPIPRADEVLVKVHAASVNSWDWEHLRTKPSRVNLGRRSNTQHKILGADIAGRVEAIGQNVRKFQPGDEVFGDLSQSGWGGFVEYVCARDDSLVLKSAKMTFEEAAAMPQPGVMALQGIRDKGGIRSGQRVLINGAGGGVGPFAVQIAKSFEAEVTGVDSPSKLDLVRSIGADHVVDYTVEDYTRSEQRYDLILDVVAYRSIFDYMRALRSRGTFVMVGGPWNRVFQVLFLGTLISFTGRKRISLLMLKPNKDLEDLIEFF